MKHFNGSVHKNTFSSIIVKCVVFLLILGLAYRMFTSSLLQISPVLVDDDEEPGFSADKTLAPPQAAADEIADDLFVNLDDHDDDDRRSSENTTEKCNLFVGDWIPDPDGPRYTNNTCHTIEGPQNCMKNGRPDSDYIYWRWKPRDCNLPNFDPKKFLRKMRYKSMAFIGDSIMRNHVQSLLCMLSQVEKARDVYHDKSYKNRRWVFPSHHFTVSLTWSPFLTKALTFEDDNGVTMDIIQLHLDELDTIWTQEYKNLDYAVIGGGKWYLKSALYYENNALIGCHNCHNPNITQLGFIYSYRKALNTMLKFITSEKHKPFVLFRTSVPDHFENGEWNTGGYCNRTKPFRLGEIEINDTDEIMRRIELEEFEQAADIASVNGMSLNLFDPTYLSLLRPDGHPGVYRQFHPYTRKDKHGKIQNDCLHWCLPGPIDYWNDLMLEMLLQGSK